MVLSHEESVIIERLLIEDEGVRKFPYLDCCGKPWKGCTCEKKGHLTIGIGRNLDDMGISDNEILLLNSNDVKQLTIELENNFAWFIKLNTPRRIVVLSMAFNLGVPELASFKKMIKAIERDDFEQASTEMMESSWSTQVKSRAVRLAAIMATGRL